MNNLMLISFEEKIIIFRLSPVMSYDLLFLDHIFKICNFYWFNSTEFKKANTKYTHFKGKIYLYH